MRPGRVTRVSTQPRPRTDGQHRRSNCCEADVRRSGRGSLPRGQDKLFAAAMLSCVYSSSLQSSSAPLAASCVRAAAAEIVLVDVGAHTASQVAAGLLIEAEVDAAVDARIVDVVGHLRERGVVERHLRNARVRQGDVVTAAAEDLLGYRAPRIARRRVRRRIARKARRGDRTASRADPGPSSGCRRCRRRGSR